MNAGSTAATRLAAVFAGAEPSRGPGGHDRIALPSPARRSGPGGMVTGAEGREVRR